MYELIWYGSEQSKDQLKNHFQYSKDNAFGWN